MGSKFAIKILHVFGLCVFALQIADAPAIAADIATPKYRICPHTKARFIRGNPCPCGHEHRKKHNAARIVSAHGDCDSDDDSDRLRAPGFEAFVFIFENRVLYSGEQRTLISVSVSFLPSGLTVDPPDTPS